VACINGIIGLLFAWILFFVTRETPTGGLLLGAAGGVYVVVSLILAALVWFMNRGKAWAFIATGLLGFALLLQVVLDLGFFLFNVDAGRGFFRQLTCVGVIHLPHLYLAIESINVIGPLRDLMRHSRRERMALRRAFEPIVPPPPPRRPR